MRRLPLACTACAAALALLGLVAALGSDAARPAPGAQLQRYAVGVADGASPAAVARRVAAATGTRAESLGPLRAVVVSTDGAERLAGLEGVAWVERLVQRRAPAYAPSDPYAAKQWHLDADRTFGLWEQLDRLPRLPRVLVAVVDSGIDLAHPDFRGRIAGARSFVGGTAQDTDGHGTFVAGVIAAENDDGYGVAGMAPSAQLLVAKVVGRDGTISPEAEARGIRWAVERGARVINMSIGGLRDPRDPARDTFSRLEANAVAYAISKGVAVVAAAGNADDAPTMPWPYASYPAALPHVVGVAALTRRGDVSDFSDRDAVHVDIAAPGEGIVSALPRSLTAERATCVEQGTSLCGPAEYLEAEGTSFAAPQVTAAIATVLALRPRLTGLQAARIVQRTAVDVNAGTGCRRCPLLRDSFTGWGALDVEAALRALAGPAPARDVLETNDGSDAPYPVWGLPRRIEATLDYWDDPVDVYRVRLRAGQTLTAALDGPGNVQTELSLWDSSTPSVDATGPAAARHLLAASSQLSRTQRVVAAVPRSGFYLVAVRAATPGDGSYTLRIAPSAP